jgi:hypothetical protein
MARTRGTKSPVPVIIAPGSPSIDWLALISGPLSFPDEMTALLFLHGAGTGRWPIADPRCPDVPILLGSTRLAGAATRSRLLGEGELPDRADRLIAAWETEAALRDLRPDSPTGTLAGSGSPINGRGGVAADRGVGSAGPPLRASATSRG